MLNSTPANDYAPVNQGQLKNIATKALAEIDAHLPVDPTDALHTMVNGWITPKSTTNDYAFVNLGQLKAVATPFYDILSTIGYQGPQLQLGQKYPWDGKPASSVNDFAMANIGQLKNMFCFDLNPPPAPTNVSAIAQGDGSVLVSWQDNSSNATGFLIQRFDRGAQDWVTVGRADAGDTHFKVDSTDAGTLGASKFQVVETSTSGNTASDGSLNDPAVFAPSVPMNIRIDQNGLHWDPSKSPTPGAIVTYDVQQNTASPQQRAHWSTVASNLSDTSLTFGQNSQIQGQGSLRVMSHAPSGRASAASEASGSNFQPFKLAVAVYSSCGASDPWSANYNWPGWDCGINAVKDFVNNKNLEKLTGTVVFDDVSSSLPYSFYLEPPLYIEGTLTGTAAAGFRQILAAAPEVLGRKRAISGNVTLTRLGSECYWDFGVSVAPETSYRWNSISQHGPYDIDVVSQNVTFSGYVYSALATFRVYQGDSQQELEGNTLPMPISSGPGPQNPGNWRSQALRFNLIGPKDIDVGAMVLSVPDGYQVWLENGTQVSSGEYRVDLSSPSGSLAAMATGTATVYLTATSGAISGALSLSEVGDCDGPNVVKMSESVSLVPFELISDLNNDGMVSGSDSQLKAASYKDRASNDDVEKGTEYLFVNDNISNGLWDKDDPNPNKPNTATDDDDVECFKVTCVATWGAVWFDHGAIDRLAFYPNKQCNASEKLTFPFVLSATNNLPGKLYIRAEGTFNGEVDSDLVMNFGPADKSSVWATDKEKLTIVKGIGDRKFFQAARNYMLEKNTRMFIHKKGYPTDNPDTEFTICVMREEATRMEAIETYYRGAGQLYGIADVVDAYSDLTVVTNGNQVFFSDGWQPGILNGGVDPEHMLSNKCHGRLFSYGALSQASSDNVILSATGSPLAGPDGKFVAQTADRKFTFAQGIVPNNPAPWQAIGGMSTDYSNAVRANLPQTLVGYASLGGDGKGVVFTASQPPMGGGQMGWPSGGHASELAQDSQKSGAFALFIGDSGRTSVALAYANPDGNLGVVFAGSKHYGLPYFVNTYFGFRSYAPRSNP